jgi:hypothetical protein
LTQNHFWQNLSTENLTVEHRNVQTASFDVKNRILVIPTLDKNLSTDLYDLFTGHEVGHALYTPIEGMIEAKRQKINMNVTNVVEDCRIERKIKYKYPGLKLPFLKAYQELIERNFFDTKGKNLNLLNFLDRLNLYTKGGVSLGIKFNDIERELLREVETTETYDDVIEVSKRIVKYMQEDIEQQKSKDKSESKNDEDEDEDYDTEDSDSGDGSDGDYDFTENSSSSDNSDDDTEDSDEDTDSDSDETGTSS